MKARDRLVALVTMIPESHVVSYGQLAPHVGVSAQMVGWMLSGLPENKWNQLPWWRVVSKTGLVSSLKLGDKGIKQLNMLTLEGIDVSTEQVDMGKHRFDIDAHLRQNHIIL